ncbi:hypothetical protein OIB37_25175 [Streptomyces sp. NBC_00820]|uniref:hypothetical protein n=1 Tax=Streptomyces sp. NBC_00820 TaxID=2975842 RepID=UPI002ED12AD3|nr:hypothetical protein OIB37_25175 [Streptomyces sp. NBC_00820]
MPADEVTHWSDVDASGGRTGARHAAPKKPLFTRFHMPAGKAIATVAMPTAVLMGMGFTSTLALAAGGGTGTSNSQKAAEYKDCVDVLDGDNASASPTAGESTAPATPDPSASDDGKSADPGQTSSPDSGSGGKAEPKPTQTSGPSGSSGSSDQGTGSGTAPDAGGAGAATPAPSTPSASQKDAGDLIDTIGTTLGDVLGGGKDSGSGTSASPAPAASQSSSGTPSAPSSAGTSSPAGSTGTAGTGGVADTVGDVAKKAADTVKDTTGTIDRTVKDTTDTVGDTAASATPDPSASATPSADDCPAATDDVSGVDNKVPVADDPWYLNASSLLLKGADYKGVVEVKTANGTTKKVLKYVISGGTDIGDLHQTVNDKISGKTYHVQAASGSTSTITGGDTVMYTESISGNLFGLVPITFSPDSPPPLNIPLIYFTDAKVKQAAQFGGNLHVPGMHVYTTG